MKALVCHVCYFFPFLTKTVTCRPNSAKLPNSPLMKDCSALWICLNEGDRSDEASKNIFPDKLSKSGSRLALMLYKPDDLLEGTYTTIGRYFTSQINCTLEYESCVTKGRVSFNALFRNIFNTSNMNKDLSVVLKFVCYGYDLITMNILKIIV